MRDCHDQSLIPEHLDGSPRRVAGDTEQVNKIFFRGQWVLFATIERCVEDFELHLWLAVRQVLQVRLGPASDGAGGSVRITWPGQAVGGTA